LATFDPQAILDAVDTGAAPGTWKVYRARESYFLEQGAIIWLTALLCVILVALAVSLAFSPATSSWTDPFRYYGTLLGLIGCACFAVFIRRGFTLLRRRRSASKQMLVLTPEGFVVRTGPSQWLPADTHTAFSPILRWAGARGGRIYSVSFDRTASIDLYLGNNLFQTRVSLIITFINPRRLTFWRIDPRFPWRDTIAQSIIEAHLRYAAEHSAAQ
jgi:hypothetical protein